MRQERKDPGKVISSVYIYAEPRARAVDFSEIASYVDANLPGIEVVLRGSVLEGAISRDVEDGGTSPESLAVSLARARVRDIARRFPEERRVLPGEVDFEHRRLTDGESRIFGILYDAHELSLIYRRVIPEEELLLSNIHIVFTNQLIGSWDTSDNRYHARTILMGSPSVVAVNGLVEAPAKAPEFYVARQSLRAMGLTSENIMELTRSFAGEYLEHDDKRMTDVAKGYALQPVAYRLTGEPFCDDPECRIYNAHWQSELLRAQFQGKYEFCSRHQRAFRNCSSTGEASWN